MKGMKGTLTTRINRNGSIEFVRGDDPKKAAKISFTVEELQAIMVKAPALIEACNTFKEIMSNR